MTEGSAARGFWAALRGAFETRELRLLQLAWASCSVAGWAFMVALAVYAYGEGGAAAVGLAAFARMAPAAAAAPFGGLVADRHSRRSVLLAVTAARALLLAGAGAAVALGAGLALVLVLAALFTMATTAHRPAQAALLPTLARTPGQLAAANAVWSGVDNAGFVAGAVVGGVAVAATSVEAALWTTAGLFALATVLLAAIPRDPVPRHRERRAGARVVHEALLGVRAMAGDRRLRLVWGVLSVSTLVEGAVDVLVVVAALELLEMGAGGVGWLNAAWGIGGLAGGAAALVLLGRGRLAGGLALGGVLAGAPLVGMGLVPAAAVALVMLVVLGAGYALVEVAGLTLMQRLTSDEGLARSFGLVEGSYWLTTGVGSLLAPLLIELLDIQGTLVALGLCLPLVVALRFAPLARLEARATVPEAEFAALRAVPLFAPLPLATLEDLCRRAATVSLTPGEDVIREGEVGDRFYVIAAGELGVSRRGEGLGERRAGDFFGEIALVRDVPRTATVTAVTESVLFALARDDFIAAVTGHPRSIEAADTVVDARLARTPGR